MFAILGQCSSTGVSWSSSVQRRQEKKTINFFCFALHFWFKVTHMNHPLQTAAEPEKPKCYFAIFWPNKRWNRNHVLEFNKITNIIVVAWLNFISYRILKPTLTFKNNKLKNVEKTSRWLHYDCQTFKNW